MSIKKAIIPAAGLGSRFLPVTKAVPKELLPLLNKPLIQYAVEEAISSGIQEIILITSPAKQGLHHYFEPDPALDSFLKEKSSSAILDSVRQIASLAHISYVQQQQPLGLGDALLKAKTIVGEEPFAIILPDDFILSCEPTLKQMIEVYQEHGGGLIAIEEVSKDRLSSYGVINPEPISDTLYKICGLVEKPTTEEAPSNLAIVGRYILPPTIFGCLEKINPGEHREVQLTDGLQFLMETENLYGYKFEGSRYDTGNPTGLLQATIALALQENETKDIILETLKRHLET